MKIKTKEIFAILMQLILKYGIIILHLNIGYVINLKFYLYIITMSYNITMSCNFETVSEYAKFYDIHAVSVF
jgi:hypothetical protein